MGQTGLESSRFGVCVGFSGLGKPDPTLLVGAVGAIEIKAKIMLRKVIVMLHF